jgi:TRAP transporter TAXI family solute receptor
MSEAPAPPAPEGVNRRSSATRLRLLQLALVVLALCAAAGGWWWNSTRGRQPATLIVGAGPLRSDSHELMREIAEVVARHSATLRLVVRATQGSSTNISLLNSGEIDLATIRADTPVSARARLVADLFADRFQLLVRASSGLVAVPDLAGKRVAIPPFGTDEFRSFWVVADHYQLPVDTMRWLAMPFRDAADRLLSGQIDAIFTVRSLRDRNLLDLFEDAELKSVRVGFLAIEQARAIAIKRPFLSVADIPMGALSGSPAAPARDIVTSAVQRLLVARDEADADAVAELTRVMFEHRLDLAIRFALAADLRQPAQPNAGAGGLGLSVHEGADRYYRRDEPSFLQENAEPLALGVTIAAMLFSGLLALRGRLVARQKNRMDSYNCALLDIAARARSAGSAEELRRCRGDLTAVLETVVRALDSDEVTEECFQSFSLLWSSVRELVNDRAAELPTT